MMIFIIACAVMLILAVVLVVRPLLRIDTDAAEQPSVFRLNRFVIQTGVVVVMIALGLYFYKGDFQWNENDQSFSDQAASVKTDTLEIKGLIEQAKAHPDNATILIKLGSAYVAASSFNQGAEAYQKAYQLTNGQDLDAITGWVEALVLLDPNAVNGRAAKLVEDALKLNPKHPRALWYGGLIALQMQNLKVARDRFQTMLSLDPPDSIRKLLERQIEELDAQLLDRSTSSMLASSPAIASREPRNIKVSVTLSPALKAQLKAPMSLFILARHPSQPGPPFAVERHQSTELPLQIDLNEADAMLPTRTLSNAEEVDVVARLSVSGAPTEQSGDLFGVAHYSFVKQGLVGALTVEINQRVP